MTSSAIEDPQGLTKIDLSGLVSSKNEVDELAQELADSYIEYFLIDTSEQQKRYADSLEECLTHLEETNAVLDQHRDNGRVLEEVAVTMSSKTGDLYRLYNQVDAIEQYMFEMSRLLEQLEQTMKELEQKRPSKNTIQQIMGLLPRLNIASNVPGLSLFSSLGGLVGENLSSPVVSVEPNDIESSVSKLLDAVQNIESLCSATLSNLNLRLHGENSEKQPSNDNLQALDDEAFEQVDSSWQELL